MPESLATTLLSSNLLSAPVLAALPAPVLASLLIEVHAGLMADPRLSHLASDIETVIYEVVAAARLRKGEAGKKAFPALRLVD